MKNIEFFRYIKVKALSILVLLLVISVQNCADLEEDPTISRLAPGQYTLQEELELGVTGIYSRLRNASQWSTFFVNGWSGDDITTHRVSNKADFREFDQRVVAPTNGRIASNWRDIYAMVRAANNALESAAGLNLPDQDAQDRLIGEVHFLRGVMFFHLTRIHGTIPLPLTSIPDFNIGLSTQEEVYQQIESDLLRAEELLPAKYPDVQKGAPRPNSGSARAMLARLYLDWAGFPEKNTSKYAEAASSAKKVMDNAGAHGFGLVEDLNDLWTLENRFNDESIWTIAYNRANGLNNRKFGKLGNPSDVGGWQETFAEIKFYEDFPEGARKDATYRSDGVWGDWENFTDQATPVFTKIVGPPGDISLDDFNTDRNDFYMRYAEVLLIYAEASGRSGNVTTEAWEALNKIRRRAAGLPYNTPDPSVDVTSGDIAELAFTERKWEFAGEWIRWNDLVRMERVKEALSDRDPQSSFNSDGELLDVQNPILGSLETSNYFAPIPQNEVDLNPNLKK
ncbi:RagB/SusD family nutrient uptake outer membrane protein [Tamlana fucoidanivorans]|uniref:RagB/SusD family nutrient uptake outer membrane protein n=1 Tax=Allotamlana fucoidanivorans TaxID=2583814 RepID=A0A5C4SRI2_9FLAO|nr:RagB/SusD family nutrient uptake outer membrane protein [Tamlana fucoidanivorans]TNJ47034.1 RagB/SusD family nutrient uptake outer membrane protein [Tamlana fucoidanivorans]